MLKHVVLLTFRPEVDDEYVTTVSTELEALRGAVPEIVRLDFGRDLGISTGNADFAVAAEFQNAEDFAAYLAHPAHLKVGDLLKQGVQSKSGIQFEI